MSAAGSTNRSRAWLRGLLAGPLALVAACVVTTGSAVWLPPGRAEINNLVLPIVLFPLLWTTLFLYACLDKRLVRAYAVMAVLALANGAVLALQWIE